MKRLLSAGYWRLITWLRRWGISIILFPLLGSLSIIRAVMYIVRFNGLPRLRIQRGKDCIISPFVYFLNPQNIHLGKGIGLAHQCYIWAGENASINIGDDTLIGPGVMIVAMDHKFNNSGPIRLQGMKESSISIGKNVWIGANAIILKGTHIGDGAVIGAGTVITKDVPDGVIMVGNSAKKHNKSMYNE